jgi:hypothetical protein
VGTDEDNRIMHRIGAVAVATRVLMHGRPFPSCAISVTLSEAVLRASTGTFQYKSGFLSSTFTSCCRCQAGEHTPWRVRRLFLPRAADTGGGAVAPTGVCVEVWYHTWRGSCRDVRHHQAAQGAQPVTSSGRENVVSTRESIGFIGHEVTTRVGSARWGARCGFSHHNVPRDLHLAVVLRQFLVGVEQCRALCPPFAAVHGSVRGHRSRDQRLLAPHVADVLPELPLGRVPLQSVDGSRRLPLLQNGA